MQPLEIPLSKKKILLLLIGSLVFVCLSIYLIIVDSIDADARMLPGMRYGWACAGIVFFGACAIIVIVKLFNNKAGLIISDAGIDDNSSGVSAGVIEWRDIIRIRKVKVQRTSFLIIDVTNPDKYISRAGGIKAKLMEMNMSMYGSPLSISTTTLNYDFEQLLEFLNEELKTRKNSIR